MNSSNVGAIGSQPPPLKKNVDTRSEFRSQINGEPEASFRRSSIVLLKAAMSYSDSSRQDVSIICFEW